MRSKHQFTWAPLLVVCTVGVVLAFGEATERTAGTCDSTKGCTVLQAACQSLKDHTFKPAARDNSSGTCVDKKSEAAAGFGGINCSEAKKTCTCTGQIYCSALAANCQKFTADGHNEDGSVSSGTCEY
jgi:hypothetical protein